MNVRFFDRQDQMNPHHGHVIGEVRWLLARIDELRERPPSFCELEADNGFCLLLGISRDLGCAQFSATDGTPPYHVLVNENFENNHDYMNFLTANTDTPISKRFCAPIDEIKHVAKEFFITGERSVQFPWEEI